MDTTDVTSFPSCDITLCKIVTGKILGHACGYHLNEVMGTLLHAEAAAYTFSWINQRYVHLLIYGDRINRTDSGAIPQAQASIGTFSIFRGELIRTLTGAYTTVIIEYFRVSCTVDYCRNTVRRRKRRQVLPKKIIMIDLPYFGMG